MTCLLNLCLLQSSDRTLYRLLCIHAPALCLLSSPWAERLGCACCEAISCFSTSFREQNPRAHILLTSGKPCERSTLSNVKRKNFEHARKDCDAPKWQDNTAAPTLPSMNATPPVLLYFPLQDDRHEVYRTNMAGKELHEPDLESRG